MRAVATANAGDDPYPTRGSAARVIARQDPTVYTDARGMPELSDYARNGYRFLPALFDVGEAGALLQCANELRDRALTQQPQEAFFEASGNALRSIFGIHASSEPFARVCEDPRVLDFVRLILGDDVYVHQSRLNFKPGFRGEPFYWHSDFETWHAEDGMPRMRAVSLSLSLTESLATNGPVMVMPGSHQTFVGCIGETPAEHYRQSLVEQRYGTPDERTLAHLADRHGIEAPIGPAGSALLFDCNLMHGSNGNITPYARTNLFVVYNASSNRLQAPFAARAPRPEFVGARQYAPLLPRSTA